MEEINIALKRCPFCGRKAHIEAAKKSFRVRCSYCGAKVMNYDLQETVERWNRRVVTWWVRLGNEDNVNEREKEIDAILPEGDDCIRVLWEGENGRYTRDLEGAVSPFIVEKLIDMFGEDNVRKEI